MSTANDRCILRSFKSLEDTSEDKELWVVSVPAVDYIRQAFFGALSVLGYPEHFNPISDTAGEYGSEIPASLYQIVTPEVITEPGYQDNLTLLHIFSTKTAGAAFIANKAVNNGGVIFQNPAALNDAFEQTFIRLRAGQWNAKVLGSKNNSGGTLNLWFEPPGGGTDIPIVTCNFYNATAQENIIFTNSGITIPVNGVYALMGKVIAPTSPSTGHLCQITCFNFQRTGN